MKQVTPCNVLSTITCEVDYVDTTGLGGWQFTHPQIRTVQDYYAFGMLKPDRTISAGEYRFGFNGKEEDDEVKGEGNSLDFGARMFDSRLRRFLSLDPLMIQYPVYSPYLFSGNSPIIYGDAEEESKILYIVFLKDPNTGKPVLNKRQQKEIIRKAQEVLNRNNIDVKVVGLISEKTLTVNMLDKTDNVVYVGNTNALIKNNIKDVKKVGHRFSNIEGFINTEHLDGRYGIKSYEEDLLIAEKLKKSQDFEGKSAQAIIHEGIGHLLYENHLNRFPYGLGEPSNAERFNLMSCGQGIHDFMGAFPYETNSEFLYFLPQTRTSIQEIYGTPAVSFKGIPYRLEFNQSGIDNYSKKDKSVEVIH